MHYAGASCLSDGSVLVCRSLGNWMGRVEKRKEVAAGEI
jgi:hypothetical protein